MDSKGSGADPIIGVRGLVKRYGAVTAVDGIDLDIVRGECFGLLGPNGAGKTTTVEILEGLLEPTAGTVHVLGGTWTRDGASLRQRIGVALQETRLADRLTVREIVELFRSFHPRGPDPDALVALVDLADKSGEWAAKLSGGQRQRLAVACALAGEPELLFLDEPTTGLDPQSRRGLWQIIADFQGRGGTVLLTTHYMDEAERLCDRVAIVDHGRVIALGTPRELIGRLGGDQIVEFATEPGADPAALAGLPEVRNVREYGGRRVIETSAVHVAMPALLDRLRERGLRLTDLTTRRASLEDVFISLTGRRLGEEVP